MQKLLEDWFSVPHSKFSHQLQVSVRFKIKPRHKMLKLKIFNIRTCFNIGLNPTALFTSVANEVYVVLFSFFSFFFWWGAGSIEVCASL